MSIDFGEKRCGLAITDSLNTCAFALDTVPTKKYLNIKLTDVKQKYFSLDCLEA